MPRVRAVTALVRAWAHRRRADTRPRAQDEDAGTGEKREEASARKHARFESGRVAVTLAAAVRGCGSRLAAAARGSRLRLRFADAARGCGSPMAAAARGCGSPMAAA